MLSQFFPVFQRVAAVIPGTVKYHPAASEIAKKSQEERASIHRKELT
jgi:hypothetical protein